MAQRAGNNQRVSRGRKAPPARGAAAEPSTLRGKRTRAALVLAAREVFENDGFLDARVTDITQKAGVAHGTFYTYFDSKEDIFREVALELQRELLEATSPHGEPEGLDPVGKIEYSNRRFLETYRRHARILAILEQVATFSDELRDIRREVRGAFVERAERALRRLQEQGLASPDLDARIAASALGSMVDRSAYVWFVLDEPVDFDAAVTTLTRLWARAIGLEQPATAAERARGGRPPRPAARA